MKKFIAAILSILYLASTSGATINMHYCMGKLVDTRLAAKEDKKCPKCGMVKKKTGKGCCEDVHKLVKVEQGHEMGSFNIPSFLQPDLFIKHTTSYTFYTPEVWVDNNPSRGSPPLTSSIPLFIRYCNFRI